MQRFLFLLGFLVTGAFADPRVVEDATEVAPGLTKTVWEYTVGKTVHDRVALHEWRGAQTPRVRVFYLPGTNMHASSGVSDEQHNLLLYLAQRGVLVQAMDYRTHFLDHDSDTDLSLLLDWTMEAFVSDAQHMLEHHSQRAKVAALPLFLMGFSRGAGYAYALAARVEAAGLIALDGSFKAPDAPAFDRAVAMQELLTSERYASTLSRRGYEGRYRMMQAARDQPGGPASDPRYRTAGEQLAATLQRAWGPGVLANTRDNVSPITVLAAQMIDYDWYFPRVQNIEARAIAAVRNDPATALDDQWGSMAVPIYYVGSGNFMPEMLLAGTYSAVRSGSRDVTVRILDGYGHTDVLTASSAQEQLFRPLLAWLMARTTP